MKNSSCGVLKGIAGISGAATRTTGPSRSSNACSEMVAATSAPNPPVRLSSEKAMRVRRHAGYDDLQSGHVRVKRLDRLRVIETTMNPAAKRRADDHRHGVVAVGAIASSRGLADDLVEGGVYEVSELDFCDGDEAVERRSDGDPADGRLGQRCVENTRFAEARVKPVGGAEHSALAADVLAHDEDAVVALHLLAAGGRHSPDHPHLRHRRHCPALRPVAPWGCLEPASTRTRRR